MPVGIGRTLNKTTTRQRRVDGDVAFWQQVHPSLAHGAAASLAAKHIEQRFCGSAGR